MVQLFTTKYPNNIRKVIAGDPVSQSVFRDDVVLECDTAGAGLPFTINLLEIPANYWSTQYKLYVDDIGNNASVRNITIVAPAGQTINNQPSVTINTNGGGVLIRIMDNGKYIATYNNFATGGGGCVVCGHTIKNEGVALPQQPNLNFIGPGVVVANNPVTNSTDITIAGGGSNFVSLTNAALQALISGGTIQPGTFYQVTNPANATSVVVQGIAGSSSSTLQGSGVFLNADYQKVGDYSGVAGFVANKGIWEPVAIPVVPGDVVIWYNSHYKNLTGNWGTDPLFDPLNWALLPKSKTNGYIEEVDFVKYNVTTNRVIYRADKRWNEVDEVVAGKGENSLELFQWGRNVVTYNKVLAGGLMVCTNSNAQFTANIVTQLGIYYDTTGRLEPGYSRYNTITKGAVMDIKRIRGVVEYNELTGLQTKLMATDVESIAQVANNIISEGSIVDLGGFNAGSTFVYNTLIGESKISVVTSFDSCNISKNFLSNDGYLLFSTPIVSGINFVGCEISDIQITINSALTPRTYTNRKIRKDFSNWEETLDMNSGIFAGGTLTINPLYFYVGIFILTNSTGKVIDKIVNQPSNHKYVIKPDAGQSVGLQHTLIAGAVADNMVCDAPAPLNTITGRVNGCDFIEYQKSGNLCLRTNLVLLA